MSLTESYDVELIKRAISMFGTTRDPNEAGYILPDGTMLDFSGRHYSGAHKKNADGSWSVTSGKDWQKGLRDVDHRELDMNDACHEGQWAGRLVASSDTSGMLEFMQKTGAMRWTKGVGFGVCVMPTARQIAMAVRFIHEPTIMVDVTTEDGSEHGEELRNNASSIVIFLKNAFAASA